MAAMLKTWIETFMPEIVNSFCEVIFVNMETDAVCAK
jgi:hypothetical protein